MLQSETEFGHEIRQVTLEEESEIRIQVHRISPLKLRLLHGRVEIFGYELPPQVWLTFPPLLQFAVFTWCGATIEILGVTETEYKAYNKSMIDYRGVHYSLHSVISPSTSSKGQRIIIVGGIDSGKSSLAKMLLSLTARYGLKPTFVDLNVGQSSITIPGTIAATCIKMPVDPVEGFPIDKALVHYFGHTSPIINLRLYKALVEELARELEQEFAESRFSGMVIDTMGWINGVGYELLVHAIRSFKATLVIVLGQEEKLVNDLKTVFKFNKNLQVLNLDKSDGVFKRDSNFRKTLRNHSIQKYFYGATNDLTVYTKTAKFSDVQVYQIGESSSSRSAQPRGNNPLKITSVEIDQHLVNKVLAISYAKHSHQIISSVVAGFVCVTDVDVGDEIITFISPSAAELPSKIFIMGTLTWHKT